MPAVDYKKEKSQLLDALLKQGMRKGYIRAETILKRFDSYKADEKELDEIFEIFKESGVDILSSETFSDGDSDEQETEFNKVQYNFYPQDNTKGIDPLQQYIKEIHRFPSLTHKEIIALSKRIADGDEKARETLINCNLKFAFSIAAQFLWKGIPLLDLVQQANIGLMTAADKYNPNRGTRFSTYATFWIKQSILKYGDECVRLIHIPEYVSIELNKVKKISAQYYIEYMKYPSDTELADLTGYTIARIKQLKGLDISCVSIDEPSGGDADGTLLMDVWTVLWADGYFNISRYIAAVISAVQFTVVYAVSNVVFLLLFAKPIGKVLERVKKKYLL